MTVRIDPRWSDKYNQQLYFLSKPGTSVKLILDDDDIDAIINYFCAE